MTTEKLLSIGKEDIKEESKKLNSEDIAGLVNLLNEKDDKVRYQALLLLLDRSDEFNDVYPYLDEFILKLKSSNSYQRSIGLMLIAENTKWDTENKIDSVIDDYLIHLKDEKPITIRQCIQALSKIVPYKMQLHDKIADKLMDVALQEIRETMKKLILVDILNILILIRKYQTNSKIDNYIFQAISGEILDKKTKKKMKACL
jgi:hypothetical protein